MNPDLPAVVMLNQSDDEEVSDIYQFREA